MLKRPANEIVAAMPKAMMKDIIRPVARRLKERANSIMMTTPGQGTMPTARASGSNPL